jgi:class 3 adenylate cyclase
MGALQPLLSDQHTHLSNNKDDNFIQIHQSQNQKDLRRASSGSVSFIIQATNTLERFAFLYTALIHDIQHVGISNEQLESEGHPVVLRAQQLNQNNIDLSDHSDKVGYNNVDIMKSYAECNSVEIGLNLLLTGSDFDHDDEEEEEEVVGVEGMGEKMKKRRRYQHLRDVLFGFAGENGGENNQQQQQQQRQQLIQTFTELVRHMVMCTDIASAERRKLGMERFERSFDKLNIDDLSDEEEDINIGDHHDDNDDLNSFLSTEDIGKLRQRAMLEQLVQLADVSHLTQSWETFLKWNRQLYVELVEAYQRRLRGLEEKQLRGDDANITKAMPPHPSNGWYQDQISFYDFYIIPLTERVQRSCALREDIILSIMENAKRNRARWVEEGLNATEKIISSAASSVGGGFVAVPLDDGDSGGLKALEKSVAKVNFGDCDDDDDEEDDVVGTADSFYRLGCNLPICVVQYLKEEACKVLVEMEPQSRPLSRWGSSSALRDNNDGTTVTEKWSWKRSSKGSDTSLLDDRSSSLYSKRRFSDVSRGSLSDDFMCDTWNSNNPLFPFPLPPQPSCHAALLLVDISGFTRLSTLLDVESLSRVINSFFEELLKEVQRYGGDVLKFAGDAFFCAWMIPSTDNHDAIQIAEQGKQVCLSAALCGASLVSKFASYFIPGLPVKDASLSVHCGLGVGTLKLIHVGDNTERREFLFLGDPVKQVAGAIECALPGDLAASSYAKECLEGASGCWCNFAADDSNGPSVIARCSDKFFGLIEGNEVQMFVGAIESVLTCPLQNAANLRQQMELYVHPSALQDRGDGSKKRRGRNQALASAELRRVFTMFVKPDVDPTLSLDKEKDAALFALLNDIMNITQSVVKRFKGHLRQFIIDDKGVVLILSWGQRGATYPHLVAEKGLPAAIALQNAFRFDLNIESRIGATVGPTYCGVLGGNNRHEFTILGSSVNLAARLACSHINEGILVDDAVRKAADDSFDFFTLEPVFAKGYDGLVPIFEPQSAIDRRWKRVDHFVGREPELEQLVRVARQMLTPKSKITTANLALIQAHSGLGKSSFSMQAVERIRKLGRTFRTDVTVLRNVCRDGEEFVPFSVFQKIILDLLVLKASIDNDFEDDSSIEISAITFDETPVVEGTSSDELQLQRLRSLCAEMNYSDGIAIWLGYHLFDLRPHLGKKEVQVNDDSKISPEDAVAFIADAFLTCISSLDFVLLGIDDGHCIDELSWRVLNLLLKRGGNNLMVLVTSRPLDSAAQADKVKPILEGLREQKCLTDLELKPFSYDDVRELISKSIGCEGRLVDEQVLQVVFEQSGGMPFFCTELIKDIIEKDLTEIHQDGTVGWKDSKAVVVS